MDLATIEMERPAAREKFLEYRRAVRRRHVEEDAEIMRGYRQLASGRQLIQLPETLRAGGVTTRTASTTWGPRNRYVLPKLAIARADEQLVYIQGIARDGGMTFFWNDRLNPQATAKNIRLPEGTWDLREIEELADITVGGWSTYWQAMVPHVPPALRPERGLAGYHILWEADWRLVNKTPRAPRDPALLKHIGGDLYAVVAIWELTELERAVLGGRS
jgi:hypothetical protein